MIQDELSRPDTVERLLKDPSIVRRAQFLCEEAQAQHPIRDIAIKSTKRAISNFESTGRLKVDSGQCYALCKYRSRKAHKAMLEGAPRNQKNFANEHPRSLLKVWTDMLELALRSALTTEKCIDLIIEYPMIVITRSERQKIPGERLSPDIRFKEIPVLFRQNDERWVDIDIFNLS